MSRKVFLFFDTFVNLQFFRRNEGAEGPALAMGTSSENTGKAPKVPPKQDGLQAHMSARAWCPRKGAHSMKKSPFALPSGEPFRPEPPRCLRTRRRRIITVNSMSKSFVCFPEQAGNWSCGYRSGRPQGKLIHPFNISNARSCMSTTYNQILCYIR